MTDSPILEYYKVPNYNLELYENGDVRIFSKGGPRRETLSKRETRWIEDILDSLESDKMSTWKKFLGYRKIVHEGDVFEWNVVSPPATEVMQVEKLLYPEIESRQNQAQDYQIHN